MDELWLSVLFFSTLRNMSRAQYLSTRKERFSSLLGWSFLLGVRVSDRLPDKVYSEICRQLPHRAHWMPVVIMTSRYMSILLLNNPNWHQHDHDLSMQLSSVLAAHRDTPLRGVGKCICITKATAPKSRCTIVE